MHGFPWFSHPRRGATFRLLGWICSFYTYKALQCQNIWQLVVCCRVIGVSRRVAVTPGRRHARSQTAPVLVAPAEPFTLADMLTLSGAAGRSDDRAPQAFWGVAYTGFLG